MTHHQRGQWVTRLVYQLQPVQCPAVCQALEVWGWCSCVCGWGRWGPCPGIAPLAWNALGNVQCGVWIVRKGYVCVLMRRRWVALVNGKLRNPCGEWASTDQSLHVWEHHPCGQRADSCATWGSQCCLGPVCTLLLWLVSPLPDSCCCVRLCLCAYELHSRSPAGFVKPDTPSSSESSGAQTASPLGLMLGRLTFEPPSPVWPKWPGQAARSAFCWVITGYQWLSVYLPMRRDSPRSANITGLRKKQVNSDVPKVSPLGKHTPNGI